MSTPEFLCIAKSLRFDYYLFPQYLNVAIHKLFRIYLLIKLMAIRFPYKHCKFRADMSIYPECNAWCHLFVYYGFTWETTGLVGQFRQIESDLSVRVESMYKIKHERYFCSRRLLCT